MARSVVWQLTADPRGFQRGFKEAERTTKQFGSSVRKTAGLIGGAFAAVQVAGFLKDAITEAREAAKVTRQTNAVIKATGGVAHVTARDVDRLSEALSTKVGVDDEVIAAGQNLLLTFRGVRNEAGKQNDIFNQATKVAIDMTAALNQGEVSQSALEQSTVRLGKALQDPVKGVSALTRVGVTFTAAQKEQIRTLVESGKTMDAQKLILKELGQEFGGAAEAAADPWSKLQVAFGNVKEDIGTVLLPAFEGAADWLSVKIPEAIAATKEALKTAKRWWDDNRSSIQLLVDLWSKDFTSAAEGATTAINDQRTAAEQLKSAFDDLLEWSLRLTQGWDILGQMAQWVSVGVLNLIKKGAQLINVIDRLSGGTGHAGDVFVDWADEGLTKAHRMIDQLREDSRKLQERIDALHGKNIDISATTSLHFTKSFTQQDWLNARVAAGRMAEGGRIATGTGPTADDVLIWASKGETVVPAKASQDPGFQRWAGMQGIPGFAQGGAVGIDNTNRAYTGVGRMMDRWGTLLMAAGVKQAMSFAAIPHVAGAWKLATSLLARLGIPYDVLSTFRPGARTHASGAVSFHALNRAVDLTGPNMLRIFEALTKTNPTELIYSGANRYKSRSGWHPIGRLDPITRADHWSHVHAAYKQGGRIPEDVFGVGRSGRTYGFHGGETVVPKGGGINVTLQFSGPVIGGADAFVREIAPKIRENLKAELRRAGKVALADQM